MNIIEIKIGDCVWGNTAININDFVSQSKNSYWCYLTNYDIHFKIAKNTQEGEELTNLLKNKALTNKDWEIILFRFCLPFLTEKQFLDLLEDRYERGLNQGAENVREGMKRLLDID